MSAPNWELCMPKYENDIDSHTERSDKRRQLFERLSSIHRHSSMELSPVAWAFFQVADLDKIEQEYLSRAGWKLFQEYAELKSNGDAMVKDALRLWRQLPEASLAAKTNPNTGTTSSKRKLSEAFSNNSHTSPLRKQETPPNEQPSSEPKPSPAPVEQADLKSEQSNRSKRNRKVTKVCKERDHGLCVVTKMCEVDACHIFPWCGLEGDTTRAYYFWETLRMFWPEEKVDSWQDKLFPGMREGNKQAKGFETVENMLTLTATLHRFHTRGAFGLRPVRITSDKTQLELEFHWLIRQDRRPRTRLDLGVEPLSSRGLNNSGPGYFCYRLENTDGELVSSGSRFTLTTEDPINKPLPDPGLLELQWHLQRILAMSGAAGWKEEDFDHDDPGTAVVARPSVVQHWLDDQPSELSRDSSSSPRETVESEDGAYE